MLHFDPGERSDLLKLLFSFSMTGAKVKKGYQAA